MPLTHNTTTLVVEVSSTGSAALKLAVKLLLSCARCNLYCPENILSSMMKNEVGML